MKVEIEQKELAAAIGHASRAVSNRATLPVLSGLRLSANGSFEVGATDLETTIVASADFFRTDEEGTVIVPSKMFAKLVGKHKGETLTLSAEDGELTIGTKRGSFRIKTLAMEDYPALPTDTRPDGGIVFTLPTATLAQALSEALAACSKDESRQVLTGILVERKGGSLSFAATDSYRLIVREISRPWTDGDDWAHVLPAASAKEILRACSKVETDAIIAMGTNSAVFKIAGLTIGARFIEGEFPNFRQLIPQGYQNALTVDRDAILGSVERVGMLAQNNLPVKLTLGDGCEMSAHTPDIGEASEMVETATYQGEPMVIAFNPDFLRDGVKMVAGDRVTISAADGLKPALIRGEDQSFLYLLMPVRLS